METEKRDLKNFNKVTVPIYEINPDGSIKPNTLFHRSWDKLHSRCVEYPYAASKLIQEERILDVGTSKADKFWIDWLESLPIDVYAIDYDPMEIPLNNINFIQADIRKLPFEDNYFDTIFAVSVIEHIGLENAQVDIALKPPKSDRGDLEAVQELKRVLKPDGKLIMTLPFGKKEGLIFNNNARNYTYNSINKFHKILKNIELHYYEYQEKNLLKTYIEFPNLSQKQRRSNISIVKSLLKKSIRSTFMNKAVFREDLVNTLSPVVSPVFENKEYGRVTWRMIPITESNSTNEMHTNGIVCGIWQK